MCLARSRHFVNVDVVFSFLCSTASAFQYSHFAKDLEVFVTNCLNNPRSYSARVDEMRVFEIVCILCADHVFWYPWFFCREFNSCVFSLFGLHANIVGSMCC